MIKLSRAAEFAARRFPDLTFSPAAHGRASCSQRGSFPVLVSLEAYNDTDDDARLMVFTVAQVLQNKPRPLTI